ncbi:MAG: hypothetical protein AB7P21_06515 [Lautropia sp.]
MSEAPRAMKRLRWPFVMLVCRDCDARKRAPKALRGKRVVSELKRGTKGLDPRPMVVSARCLKLCPKGALVLAVVGGAGDPAGSGGGGSGVARLALLRAQADVDAALDAARAAGGQRARVGRAAVG